MLEKVYEAIGKAIAIILGLQMVTSLSSHAFVFP